MSHRSRMDGTGALQHVNPGVLWIRAAVIYFMPGIGLDIYMGDAHFKLLGDASLALVGMIYQQFLGQARIGWQLSVNHATL